MTNKNASPHFGNLSPRYRFILNPHADLRCSTCPECDGKMLVRKVPLVVAVLPDQKATINKHCRYCPHCDILNAHQDELENMLAITFEKHAPKLIGNEYLVIGTLEPAARRKREKRGVLVASLPDIVHDFKERLELEHVLSHWGPADDEHPEMSKREADRRSELETIAPSISVRKRYKQNLLEFPKKERNMPVTYTNRKGQKYFLCQGSTRSGSVRYYFSPDPHGNIVKHLSEGCEIHESVNGQVTLAKAHPALIRPEERTVIEQVIAKHPMAGNYRVDIKGKQIIVYENTGPDMDVILDVFQQAMPVPRTRVEAFLAKAENFKNFSPILRFTLKDPDERIFGVERMYFLGEGGWRAISQRGKVAELAKELIPLLNTDEFFELF
jgi:hypothetical protein